MASLRLVWWSSLLLFFYPALPIAQTVSDVPGASKLVLSRSLEYAGYGIHEPHGLAAVRYLYGSEGTWRSFTGLKNDFGYYNVPDATKAKLLAYADGTKPVTCLDPDHNVLFQLGDRTAPASGSAFMEHNGRGADGAASATPFSQFWYDDNWLARYASASYGAPQPEGLYPSPGRWQIIGLDAANWPHPAGSAPDQQALVGLYHLAVNDVGNALAQCESLLRQAGDNYDLNNQRYTYPLLNQTYYLGLFKILVDRVLAVDGGVRGASQTLLIQHSMSLSSILRSEQQIEKGVFIGWCTDRNDNTSLINTESTVIPVLGLGAGSKYSFEADAAPMVPSDGFFVRPYGALSAVAGLSPAGLMVSGPNITLPRASYTADFYLRSGSPGTALTAQMNVWDVQANEMLASKHLAGTDLPGSNQWARFSIGFNVNNTKNQIEFRVNWGGQADLDVSAIRVR